MKYIILLILFTGCAGNKLSVYHQRRLDCIKSLMGEGATAEEAASACETIFKPKAIKKTKED
jgi:hypothetical protein